MLQEVLLCLVISVTDGDTLTARCERPSPQRPVKVRIASIDAPERGQPYGAASRQNLRALCLQQWAQVMPRARDRYGRLIADVRCRELDVGMEQVSAGLAWAYGRSRRDTPVRAEQEFARHSRIGLWARKNPTPPWQWRKENPSARSESDNVLE